MGKDILAALVQLDPDNDDHWTSDGSPRLDVLEPLLRRSVKRAEVTAAAPKFRRTNLVLPDGSEPSVEAAPEDAAPAPIEDGEADAADSVSDEPEGTPEEQAVAVAERALAEAEAAQAQAQRAVAQAQAARDRAVLAEQRANEDPHSNQRTIMSYLESQQRLREERGERAAALREAGIGPALMETRARIDAAMAQRRAIGQQRPSRG